MLSIYFNIQLWIKGFVLKENFSLPWSRGLGSLNIGRYPENIATVDSLEVFGADSSICLVWKWEEAHGTGFLRYPSYWHWFLIQFYFCPFRLLFSEWVPTTLVWPNHKSTAFLFPSQYSGMHLLYFLAHLILFYLEFNDVFRL